MDTGDRELLRRWSNDRDADAFHEIVSRYAGMVYGACLRILSNPQEAEDVSQDCFLTLATAPTRVRSSLGGWLHKLATHRALNHLKSSKRRKTREEGFAMVNDTRVGPDWDDTKAYIDEAIESLPKKYRATVISHFLDGQTYGAIAAAQGVPVSTVASRAHRGVERIREMLKKRGISIPATTLATFLAEHSATAAPAALISSLGKLAIAGKAGAVGGVLYYASSALVSKGVAVAVGVVAIGVFSWWMLDQGAEDAVEATNPIADRGASESATIVSASDGVGVTAATVPLEDSALGVLPNTVAGRVYDADTRIGLQGVIVHAQQGSTTHSVETEANGDYALTGLTDGHWRILYEAVEGYQNKDGLEDDSVLARVEGGMEVGGVDFPMATGTRFTGVVVDGAGQPIAGARVYSATQNSDDYNEAYSHEDGSFVLTAGLCAVATGPRRYHIVASKGGYGAFLTKIGPLNSVSPEGYRIVLEPEAIIEGIVADQEGIPREGYRLSWSSDGVYLGPLQGPTDSQGRFRLTGLAAGGVRVRLYPPGMPYRHSGNTIMETYEVAAGEVLTGVEVLLEKKEGWTISGRTITASGYPIAGAGVGAMTNEILPPYGAGGHSWSSEDGFFQIDGLPDAAYSLSAQHPEYSVAKLEGIPVGSTGLTVILPDHGAIEGVVRDGTTGLPIQDFMVQTFLDDTEYSYRALTGSKSYHGNVIRSNLPKWRSYLPQRVHDQLGRFMIDGVKVGSIRARVLADGYAPATVDFPAVVSGVTTGPVEIDVHPSIRVTGSIVDSEGHPVEGAEIYQRELRGLISSSMVVAQTQADGSFALDDMNPGAATLSVTHTDFFAGKFNIDVQPTDNEPLQLILSKGGIVEGSIRVDGEIPTAGNAYVTLEYTDAQGRYQWQHGEDLDDEGRYRILRLPSTRGRVRCIVTVRDPTRYELTRYVPAQVNLGETTTVDFDIRTGTSVLSGTVYQSEGVPANARVRLHTETAQAEQRANARTGEDGYFEFKGLIGGAATLTATAPGLTIPEMTFDLRPNTAMQQDVLLFGGMTIDCSIVNLPSTSRNVAIYVLPGEVYFPDPNDQVFIRTGSDEGVAVIFGDGQGVMRIAGLEPGTYTILCRPDLFDNLPGPSGHPLRSAALPYTVVTLSEENPIEQVVFEFEPDWLETMTNK